MNILEPYSGSGLLGGGGGGVGLLRLKMFKKYIVFLFSLEYILFLKKNLTLCLTSCSRGGGGGGLEEEDGCCCCCCCCCCCSAAAIEAMMATAAS